jgi:hypothetical protein
VGASQLVLLALVTSYSCTFVEMRAGWLTGWFALLVEGGGVAALGGRGGFGWLGRYLRHANAVRFFFFFFFV